MFVWEGGIFIPAFLVCVFLLLLIFTSHHFHDEIINQMPKWPWLPKTHRILLVPRHLGHVSSASFPGFPRGLSETESEVLPLLCLKGPRGSSDPTAAGSTLFCKGPQSKGVRLCGHWVSALSQTV